MFRQAEGPFVSQTQIHAPKQLCKHIRGSHYEPYIQLTRTCNFGGISPLAFALLSRRHFPYKPFPALKGEIEPTECPATSRWQFAHRCCKVERIRMEANKASAVWILSLGGESCWFFREVDKLRTRKSTIRTQYVMLAAL